MGRKENRHMEKKLKEKLTPEQFSEIKSAVIEERVKEEVDRFIGNFVAVFKPSMRENHISDERADRIIVEVFDRANKRFVAGETGEERSKEVYIEQDTFEKIASEKLAECGVKNPEVIANNIYREIMNSIGEETEQC